MEEPRTVGFPPLSAPQATVIAGWRATRLLGSAPGWRRFAAQLPAPGTDRAELIVESADRPGYPLSDLCDLLARLDVPSLPRLLDIGVTEDRAAVAILEPAAGPDIAALLARGYPLRSGEVVTLLAPIAETLGALHDEGVAFGGLGTEDVHLDAMGRPVLCGWDRLVDLGTSRGSRGSAAVALDWRTFEEVADVLFEQLTEHRQLPLALERELDRCVAGESDEGLAARLTDALYGWQDGAPVDVGGAIPDEAQGDDQLLEPADHVAELHARTVVTQSLLDDEPASAALRSPAPRSSRRERTRGAGPSRVDEALRAIREVRLPFKIAAFAILVMLGCAGLLLFEGHGSSDSRPEPSVAAASPTPSGDPLEALPPSASAPPPPPELEWERTAEAEDPVAAAAGLLARRLECLRGGDAICLQALYQPDAPGLAADIARLEAAGGGETGSEADTGDLRIRDQYGALVVLDVWAAGAPTASETPTASLTVVRGEAGWRLRDVRVTAA